MHGALVIGVTGRLELERRMFDVEVAAQAVLEHVEHDRAPAVGEHVGLHDDVHGQHGQARRDGPHMQVVHVAHAGQAGQVRPDLAQVDAARACLEQNVDRIGEQPPGARQDQGADEQRGDGEIGRASCRERV